MGRPKGSKDILPRRSQARYSFADHDANLVQMAADILKDADVEPKVKLEFISKMLPYMFPKMNVVRKDAVDSEDDADEPVMAPEDLLKALDQIKGRAN